MSPSGLCRHKEGRIKVNQLISCIEIKVTNLQHYKVLFYHGRKTAAYGATFQMFPSSERTDHRFPMEAFDADNSAPVMFSEQQNNDRDQPQTAKVFFYYYLYLF